MRAVLSIVALAGLSGCARVAPPPAWGAAPPQAPPVWAGPPPEQPALALALGSAAPAPPSAQAAPLAAKQVEVVEEDAVDQSEPPPEAFDARTLPDGAACIAALEARRVTVRPAEAQRGVRTPVILRSDLGGVKWHGGAGKGLVADCRLVLALARLSSEFRAMGVTEAIFSGAYSYRLTRQGRWSLHAYGLAVDVHEFVIDGRRYRVDTDYVAGMSAPCAPDAPELNRLACRLRATGGLRELLTPDSNADHRNHFHLGIAPLTRAGEAPWRPEVPKAPVPPPGGAAPPSKGKPATPAHSAPAHPPPAPTPGPAPREEVSLDLDGGATPIVPKVEPRGSAPHKQKPARSKKPRAKR